MSGRAVVLLDDTWADGTRTNQNLPTESAWYASTGPALISTTGSLTLALGSGAIMFITYFTANDAIPVHLGVGDTLSVTVAFAFNGIAAANGSQGFRLGLLNFADSTLSPKRVSADFSGNNGMGNGVQGYALFQNMGVAFGSASPTDIRKRTNLVSTALLGTSGDWTSLITGPGNTNTFQGFINGTNYTLHLTLQRMGASSLAIGMTWLNVGNGATLSTSTTDNNATNFNFDGIALRPQNAASSASTITFHELKVELISGSTPASIGNDPQDRAVFTSQDASFTVVAGGSAPLSYQWFYNTNTLLDNATNATLTLTNVQLADAGGYSVIVTNPYGSATGAVATLTVSTPVAPSIGTQPQSQTVVPGQSVNFSVIAGGSEPLSYQWYYNTNTLLPNATESVLTLTNVQADDAGRYSVFISNLGGSTNSSYAILTINTNDVAPSFVTQPVSIVVLMGGEAGFSSSAIGSEPLTYQWKKNGAPISGANLSTLNLTNVQPADSGTYTITASNSVDSVTSDGAVLIVTPWVPISDSAYNLYGFGEAATGGGVLLDNNPNYRKVFTPDDLRLALASSTVKVIEIMNDLNLGWNELPASAQTGAFRQSTAPSLHPALIASGITTIDIQNKNGLTIFSTNGATIRHAEFNIKRCGNVLVRNLRFDELWEWDEATKGDYDSKDWDFITLGDGGASSNIWIDHCDFTKAYDGVVDMKGGSHNITLSWCRFVGDGGGSNSFVRQQINFLEQNPSSHEMYGFLRTNGFSVEDIIAITRSQKKGHLVGATSLNSENNDLSVTLHHNYYLNMQDRMPRLRAGNAHAYNLYVKNTEVLAAKRLRNSRVAAMTPSQATKLNNGTYKFDVTLNGAISTEDGAVQVEKCYIADVTSPIRNNQTDPNDPLYTGKIRALDTIYKLDATTFRGGSEDVGSPLRPVPAPIKPFTWNGFSNLPYSYTMDDPSQLPTLLATADTTGAGKLYWNKTNWMKTSYPLTAPFIVSLQQTQTVSTGQVATFFGLAGGSAPLRYQWYFNTNTLLTNATNPVLTLTNVQTSGAGVYSIVVTNGAGSVTGAVATLIVDSGASGFETWRMMKFNSEELADPLFSGPDATPAGDGIPNFVKYALGLEPFIPAAQPLVGFRVENGDGVLTYHRPASTTDVVYRVEVSIDLVNWTETGVTQQFAGTDGGGLQIWEAHHTGSSNSTRYFRLVLER